MMVALSVMVMKNCDSDHNDDGYLLTSPNEDDGNDGDDDATGDEKHMVMETVIAEDGEQ